jgi:Ser/Thr protein kinase RdoA (MazF antagonist)
MDISCLCDKNVAAFLEFYSIEAPQAADFYYENFPLIFIGLRDILASTHKIFKEIYNRRFMMIMDTQVNNTRSNRSAILKLSRKAAILALQQYELEWKKLVFIGLSEHVTYKVVTGSGIRFLLRVHDSESINEIASELKWLDALQESGKLHVPAGLANRSGSCVTEVVAAKDFRRSVTVMRWVKGRHAGEHFSVKCLEKIGRLLSRLHQASSSFIPPQNFERPVRGEQSFVNCMQRLEQHCAGFLTVEEFTIYQKVAAKIGAHLERLQKEEHGYGMIHADLHTGNLVFHGGEPYPIDFGRCGFGYYLYDIAQTLVGLYPPQRKIVVESYASARELSSGFEPVLETFFIMACIENISFHASNPLETDNLVRQQPYLLKLLRCYLEGTPFLF